jgi:hypothetical protein
MPEPLTAVERAARARGARLLSIAALVLLAGGFWGLRAFNPDFPRVYGDIEDHFKYGSIGSEAHNGIPARIWEVLPEICPNRLPAEGYASFGFVFEDGRDRPIGIADRQVVLDRVGLNCAVCHTGTVRETPDAPRRIVLAMPANTFDLQAYFRFLAGCAADGRFTADNVVRAIERRTRLDPAERFLYRLAVPQTRDELLERNRTLAFMDSRPDWGPGRVDTFNPYKTIQFGFPMEHDHTVGATDLPSIWNQRPRQGMQLHWDGNNVLVEERNRSAALGAGVTPTSIDHRAMRRVEDWLLDLPAPRYPWPIDEARARTGASLYRDHCTSCHDFDGALVGRVTPIGEIGTDRGRLDSFTYELAANMNLLFAGYPWRFQAFRKTDGYANQPLDGVWLRAPYLHNGSVPTLRDLLEPPEARPAVFYRGYDVYDRARGGFVGDVAEERGRRYFRFDTALPGNGNGGHLYGTDLSPDEKDALVEYLKTL